ncbi:MAG: hypothetical protein O7D30_07480, partial [Rickettsia endosymbiont of Ixodes persulcatus]|nr:hypothetical protein [Rickettsia endosymbiont of Ixodes persulcatus]
NKSLAVNIAQIFFFSRKFYFLTLLSQQDCLKKKTYFFFTFWGILTKVCKITDNFGYKVNAKI